MPGDAVDRSVNCTPSGAQPALSFTEKFTAGFAYTVTKPVRVSVLLPLPFVAVSVTVYVPGVKYVVEGFCRVDVTPLPKFHCQLVGLPVDWSWKLMITGAQPAV